MDENRQSTAISQTNLARQSQLTDLFIRLLYTCRCLP